MHYDVTLQEISTNEIKIQMLSSLKTILGKSIALIL